MAPPPKSSDRRKRASLKEREGDASPSLNLWVGDLAPDTVDSDLMAIFKDYGAMDALTSYHPRTYAFVFFRNTDDAKKAKEELQGSVVRGNAIRVEFARPAKPGKTLWIGGISSSVTAEELEDELLQFGKLEVYRFLRDRNSALVGYCKIDDAIAAQKNINGKSIGGEQVRVDFQKPQTSRRDWPDIQNSRGNRRNVGPDEAWVAPDEIGNYHESSHQGSKRHLPHGGRHDGPPSNTLWVGYPPSFHMDEQMLHNAMILFGEIERIKSFPSRHYSFVEFRSVDEARRAKEGLQGRLFGDPRIQIMFSSSDLAPGKDSAPLLPGYRVPRPDMPFQEAPFGTMEFFGPSRPMASNSFPGCFPPNGPGPNMLMRSQATRGFDSLQGDPDFHDFGTSIPNFPDGNPNAPNWRRLSPAPGVNSSSLGMRQPARPIPNVWEDGFDMREPKRSRLDSPSNDAPHYGRRVRGEAVGDMFGPLHPEREISGQSHLSPIVRGPSRLRGSPDLDHCWRGVIAKGGSPVCHARCVPIGSGLESPLPEVVNCFARTDLDMLTKHYGEAVGFDIVFFLPDSEDDFASYTEFLQYLGLKNRVGVAKCDDGATLFLVPPSDFLTKVLKVSGPERLYGVVLKLPHQSTNDVQRPQATHLPMAGYREQMQEPTSHDAHSYMLANEDSALRVDYGSLHDSVSRAAVTHANPAYSTPLAPQDYSRSSQATSQLEVSLTPELIATLTSLLPSSSQPSTAGSHNMSLINSVTSSSFPASVASGPPVPAQGWIQESKATLSASQLEPRINTQQQQFGFQYNTHAQFTSQYPTYSNLSNGLDNSAQTALNGVQVQDLASNMPHVSAAPSRQLDGYGPTNGQSLVASDQHNQHNASFDSYNAHVNLRETSAMSALNQPARQSAPSSSGTPGQSANVQNQMASNGVQQIQMSVNMSGDGTSQGDAERNQRYQSTLQLAASLLQRIHQQQHGSGQAAGGSGSQQ